MRDAGDWRWMLAIVLTVATTTAGQVILPGDTGEDFPRAAIYLEDSPAAQELVEEAARLRRDDRIPDAVAVYQKIIDEYPQKLMTRGHSRYFDTVRWVHQELASDPQLSATYRRMYEATAQRELAQAAESANEMRALEGVVRRYLLCTSGIEAGLRLAALYLAEGNLVDAGAVLNELAEHPDLSQHAARYHMLQAAVGLFAGQSGRFNEHRAALEELNQPNMLAQLDRWATTLRRPASLGLREGIVELPQAEVPEVLGEPLWAMHTPTVLRNDGIDVRSRVPRGNNRTTFPMLPVVDGSVLYLNNTRQIIAMDRISRRVLWQYEDENANAAVVQQFRANTGASSDIRSLLLHDGRVYGILGQTPDALGMWQRAGVTTALICLDEQSGSVLWKATPGELDPTLERGYFHGTPLAGPGRIYALVRRSQTGFYESFVVAVDATSGSLLWRRHLSSASSAIRTEQPPFAQMSVFHGQLYVVDHQGTVSNIDGRTGAIRWLTITSDQRPTTEAAIARGSRLLNAGFDTPPVLVEAGLIVNAFSDANPVLLDPQTGRKLRELTDATIARSQFMLPCGDDVLSVGRQTHLLDGRTLEPRWTRTLDGVSSSTTIGLPWVTRDAVWLAAGNRINVLSLADGAVRLRAEIAEAGNAVAIGPQLLIAGPEKIYNYMDWTVARRSLRQQITDEPNDPRPGLALAELALATSHYDSVLEGVDHVLAAMHTRAAQRKQALATDPMQPMVFAQVRSMVNPERTPDPLLREKLFERLAAVSAGPADEVVYLLALASFEVEIERFAKAVEHYQTILKTPQLASQPYKEGFVAQQAGQEARNRMVDIVAKAPNAYARFDAEATQRLAEITSTPHIDIDALVELARQYPLANAAATALLTAGEAAITNGDAATGVTLLRRAYTHSRSQNDAERIVGRLAQTLDDMEQPRQAVQWLRKAMRDYPGIQPIRAGMPTPANVWLAELVDKPDLGASLPKLTGPLQRPNVLKERVLLPTRQPATMLPHDGILTQAGSKLQWRTGPGLQQVKWQATAPKGEFDVLSLTEDRILLWQRDGSRLIALDARNGVEAWPPVDIDAELERIVLADGERQALQRQPAREHVVQDRFGNVVVVQEIVEDVNVQVQLRVNRQLVPIQNDFDRNVRRHMTTHSLVEMNDTVVAVCDRFGRVTGVDRLTGQVLFAMRCPFEAVSFMKVNEDYLVLAGITGKDQDRRHTVVVLDALSGALRHAGIEMSEPISWMELTHTGVVVLAAGGNLIGYDVERGNEIWRQPITHAVIRGVALGDRILFIDEGRSAIMVDPTNGQRHSILAASDGTRGYHPRWDHAQDAFHILTAEQAMAISVDGQTLWRDAIFDDPKNLHVQLLSEKYAVLVGFDHAPPVEVQRRDNGPLQFNAPAERQHHYRIYLLNRDNGMIMHQQRLGPLPEPVDPNACTLIDNHLIFGTAQHTIIVPGVIK